MNNPDNIDLVYEPAFGADGIDHPKRPEDDVLVEKEIISISLGDSPGAKQILTQVAHERGVSGEAMDVIDVCSKNQIELARKVLGINDALELAISRCMKHEGFPVVTQTVPDVESSTEGKTVNISAQVRLHSPINTVSVEIGRDEPDTKVTIPTISIVLLKPKFVTPEDYMTARGKVLDSANQILSHFGAETIPTPQ